LSAEIEADVRLRLDAVAQGELLRRAAGEVDLEAREAVLLVEDGAAALHHLHRDLLELGDRNALDDGDAPARAAEVGEVEVHRADNFGRAGHAGLALFVDAAADAHAVVGAEAELERLARPDEAGLAAPDHRRAARDADG